MSITQSDFSYIRDLVRERSAIVLEPGKEYLAVQRLGSLVAEHKLSSLRALVEQLRKKPFGPLHRQVIEAMTTNETSFFRDQHPFDSLRTHVLPELIKARKDERKLNIWSAACSSGQEAYSIAMVIKESFPALDGWGVRITGTDVSREMVSRTKEGRFSALEVSRGLPPALLHKYLERVDGGDFRVGHSLRSMVDAAELNLAAAWPFRTFFDVVFMRNVLIYFDVATKRELLRRLRSVLRPDGYLCLGASETMLSLDDQWVSCALGRSTYYRPASSSR